MNNAINCAITDDEPFARKGLQGYVEKTSFLALKGVCEDALELSSLLHRQKIDLLFLDIQMPHISGIEYLKTLPAPPKVIFTTAFEQYAIQGFELDVMDYLLKPISFERFLKAAWKAKDYFSLKNQTEVAAGYMFVKAGGKLEKVNFPDILFIEGMENYVAIYLEDKKLITHSTIKGILDKLPENQFIQTHKSYIAAVGKVDTIDGNTLHIKKHEVPVSKNLRDDVLRIIMK
jgi:DNA-binding LytR/AlgR family response regulator